LLSLQNASQTPITANGSIPCCSSVGNTGTTTADNAAGNNGASSSTAVGANVKLSSTSAVTSTTAALPPQPIMAPNPLLLSQPVFPNLLHSSSMQSPLLLHPQISPNYGSSVHSSSSSSNPNHQLSNYNYPSTSAALGPYLHGGINNIMFTGSGPIVNNFIKTFGQEWDTVSYDLLVLRFAKS